MTKKICGPISLLLGFQAYLLTQTTPPQPQILGLATTPPVVHGLIIPHHLLVEPLILQGLSAIPKTAGYDQILFLFPNHAEQPDLNLENAYLDILPYLKKRFPHTPIHPLMISNRDPNPALPAHTSDTLVVGAFDFSHYLSAAEAAQKDKVTLEAISRRDYPAIASFNSDYTDSPVALTVFLKLMSALSADQTNLIANTNSGLLTRQFAVPTTSYFVMTFSTQ